MRGDDPWSTPDPIGEALHVMRVDGTFYCRSELTEPWGLTMPTIEGCLWFHAVTAGRCLLEVDGAEPLHLGPGDLVLVPHHRGHRARSAPDVPTPDVTALPHDYATDRYAVLRYGGGGPATTIVCGGVRLDHPGARNLIDLLPPYIHIAAANTSRADWVQSTLRLVADEASELRPGGEAVIVRLSDILVIQAIRSWLDTAEDARTGWLGALRDEHVGRAISLVHRHPARDWTVADLASELAMSRSAFAARFTELVGEPVMRYVTRHRMHLALERMRDDHATVGEVAAELGYRSEAAFSRAFKRTVGVSPGRVRAGAPVPGTEDGSPTGDVTDVALGRIA